MVANRHQRGVTLLELLATMLILFVLVALLSPSVGRAMSSAKSAKSIANLKELHRGVVTWAGDNNGRYPVTYENSSDDWFSVVSLLLYSKQLRGSPKGYEGSVFRSPNAEPKRDIQIASYGYNAKFTSAAPRNIPAAYSPIATMMLGDNFGQSHAVAVDQTTYSKLNPRNGASAPKAADGNALVIFVDGHTESLTAARCEELNKKPGDIFWGVRQ